MSRENDVFSQIAVCLLHALGFISWSLEISSHIGLYLIQMRNVSCKKDFTLGRPVNMLIICLSNYVCMRRPSIPVSKYRDRAGF